MGSNPDRWLAWKSSLGLLFSIFPFGQSLDDHQWQMSWQTVAIFSFGSEIIAKFLRIYALVTLSWYLSEDSCHLFYYAILGMVNFTFVETQQYQLMFWSSPWAKIQMFLVCATISCGHGIASLTGRWARKEGSWKLGMCMGEGGIFRSLKYWLTLVLKLIFF